MRVSHLLVNDVVWYDCFLMATNRLKTVFRPLGHTEALKNGTVQP